MKKESKREQRAQKSRAMQGAGGTIRDGLAARGRDMTGHSLFLELRAEASDERTLEGILEKGREG